MALNSNLCFLLQDGELDNMLHAWENALSFQQDRNSVSGHPLTGATSRTDSFKLVDLLDASIEAEHPVLESFQSVAAIVSKHAREQVARKHRERKRDNKSLTIKLPEWPES